MLKGKSGVSACSLSSCRTKAEALARALNSRIWPCTWVDRRSADESDGMSNGMRKDDDEELFFDASPSPIEDEEESLYRHENSSAATAAGRAKLYELLQQHATDDATDVFYDVSEDAGLSDEPHASEDVKDMYLEEGGPAERSKSENGLFTNVLNEVSDSFENCKPDSVQETKVNDTAASEMKENLNSIDISESQANTSVENIENELDMNLGSNFEASDINFNLPENEDINGEEADFCTLRKMNIRKIDKVIPHSDKNVSFANAENTDDDACKYILKSPSDYQESESTEEDNNICITITNDLDSPSSLFESRPSVNSSNDTSPVSNRLQVFDEERPRIERSTSLKTGKTPPSTPNRKKIVRFADVLGLDLEDVHHIMVGDLPNIPSSAYADLVLADEDLPMATSQTVNLQNRPETTWESLHGAIGPNVLHPLFVIPSQQQDFLERVRGQGICLESVTVSDMSVQCTCRVMNWGFRKKVVARYTVNDWESSIDINASYVPGSSQGEMDNFSFSIFLSPTHRKVEFALRYTVNGNEYWDNNRLQNYSLGYHGNDNIPQTSDPMWQHQFW